MNPELIFVFVIFAALLAVIFNDINDYGPEFSEVKKLKFRANTCAGQLFGIIVATDKDGPPFNEVRYELM
jgi:hypothetical protein